MSLQKVPIWLFAIVYGISRFPKNALAYIIISLAVAFIPALNVVITAQVFNSLNLDTGGSTLWAVIVLGLLFGVGTIINAVPYPVGFMLFRKVYSALEDDYEKTLTNVSPRLYSDNDFIKKSNAARQAAQEELVPMLCNATIQIIAAIFTTITLSMALWSFNPTAGLISIFVPIPMIFGTALLGYFETKIWPVAQAEFRLGSYYEDQLSYQRSGIEIASMKAGEQFAQRANGHFLNFIKLRQNIHRKSAIIKLTSGLTSSVLFGLALYNIAQDATLGTIFAGIAGLVAGISSMVHVGWAISDFVLHIPGATHLINFLRMPLATEEVISSTDITKFSLKEVRVSYDTKEVVKGVNLEINSGSFTALIGENGSGKTSLLKAIMGMQLQASGIIDLGKCQLDLANKDQVVNYTAVNQEFGRYELTLEQFLTLGLKYTPTVQQLWYAIDQVEMREVISEFAHGFKTKLGVQWGGVDLSGGQWQRLAIARCFLSENKIMILDEPTSAIDAPTEERIFQRLAQLGKDKFIFLTTHRASSLKEASNIYVMDHGTIVEQGTFKELDKPGTHFVKMFESQLNTRISHQEANHSPPLTDTSSN